MSPEALVARPKTREHEASQPQAPALPDATTRGIPSIDELTSQLAAEREEIGQLAAQLQRLDAERDEFVHLLLMASSNVSGRLGLRWKAFTERHPWARQLISRPSRFLWLGVMLRKPGFIRINPLFDADYYMERYQDVPRGKRKAWWHYRRHGVAEGRDPNAWFDTSWYLESNPDVAGGRVNPLDHYLDYGWAEARNPSQRFDGFDYLRHHPDCVVTAMNPLLHFLRSDERTIAESPAAIVTNGSRINGRTSTTTRTIDYYQRNGAWRTLTRVKDELRGTNGHGALNGVGSPDGAGVLALAEQVRAETIHAHIDTPDSGSIEAAAALVLSGWACSDADVESVSVYLDASHLGNASIGRARPDVAEAFPSVAGSGSSGFSLRIPLDEVEPGRGTLQVIIRDSSGATRVMFRSFLRIAPEAAYHQFYERLLPTPGEVAEMKRWAAAETALPDIRLCLIAGGRDARELRATIRSISGQAYPSWSCTILADGTRTAEIWKLINESDTDDYRWRVVARDAELLPATPEPGTFIGFLRAGETLAPQALFPLASEAHAAETSLVYSDHDAVERTGCHVDPWFVWDWSPDRLLCQDYIGGFYLARDTESLRSAIKSSIGADSGTWRYDLLLRITDSVDGVRHVPKVLWSAPARPGPASGRAGQETSAVKRTLERRGLQAEVLDVEQRDSHPVRRIRWPLEGEPKVSIIIPTTGRLDLVRETLASLQRSDYANTEVIFLDNSRGDNPDGIAYLESSGVTILESDESFNWAKLSNDGARIATGELLLFLNDDLHVRQSDWLEELVHQAARPGVGVAGPLLEYPDGRIQHAGVFLVRRGGGAVHLLHGVPRTNQPYLSLDAVTRETSAVTGACMMVSREAFEDVGGFDEALAIVGNDVDLCLRLIREGYRNIWTPDSALVHHESASRTGVSHLPDEAKVWERWADVLDSGDPYYNPNLAQDRADCSLGWSNIAGRPKLEAEVDHAYGVNLVGYIRAEMGVGEATRGEAQALTDAGTPFVIIDHSAGNPARMGDASWLHKTVAAPVFDTNILHFNADVLPTVLEQLPTDLRDGRRNIGFWTWELPEFPDEWVDSFDLVDEVWVPSTFVHDAVARKSPVPVSVVPHAVRNVSGPFLTRDHFNLPKNPYQFMTTYDPQSIRERKNPAGALEAFGLAFDGQATHVSFVVKVNSADRAELRELRRLIGEDSRIHLVTGVLDRYEMDSLMATSDAVVSLHRAEGFGLHLAEAMRLGLPVVATGWSGNMDFMDEDNSICVPYKLVALDKPYGPYAEGQRWADPDLDKAAASMRSLAEDPELGIALGKRGQSSVAELLDPMVVGLRVGSLLRAQ